MDTDPFGVARPDLMEKFLSSSHRAQIPTHKFGLPHKAKGKEAKKESGNYPMPDIEHARNALSRAAQHASPKEEAQIERKAHSLYPSIGKAAGPMGTGLQVTGEVTVDGHVGVPFTFSDPGVGDRGSWDEIGKADAEVGKQYYYGSAPVRRRNRASEEMGGAAFLGAAAGTQTPRATRKVKAMVPRVRAATTALRAK